MGQTAVHGMMMNNMIYNSTKLQQKPSLKMIKSSFDEEVCFKCQLNRRWKLQIEKISRITRPLNFIAVILIFLNILSVTQASGTVDVIVSNYLNQANVLATGSCCASSGNISACQTCQEYLKICLQSYRNDLQSNDKLDSNSCPFGSLTTETLGMNDLAKVQFRFAWPGSMTILVEVRHRPSLLSDQSYLITRSARSIEIDSRDHWHTISHYSVVEGNEVVLRYRTRVTCSANYHGRDCNTHCRPRNHSGYGHYTCDEEGAKRCLPGWNGTHCNEPVCSKDCGHNGRCIAPDTCMCNHGWKGEKCDECIPYPGCIHGTCNKPGECICKDRWGGQMCADDLDYCYHHRPCYNGATCVPDKPNDYRCRCTEGFAGRDCQIVVTPCSQSPCRNYGTCTVIRNEMGAVDYRCLCDRMHSGRHCELSLYNAGKPSASTGSSDNSDRAYLQPSAVSIQTDSCFYQGNRHPDGTYWETLDCRQCNCIQGVLNCSEANCNREDCLQESVSCPHGQICRQVLSGQCLKPPCHFGKGECSPWQWLDRPTALANDCKSRQDAGERTSVCARFYMAMDDSMPTGTTLESVCYELKLVFLTLRWDNYLPVCRLRPHDDLIEVDVVSLNERWPVAQLRNILVDRLNQNLTVSWTLRAVRFALNELDSARQSLVDRTTRRPHIQGSYSSTELVTMIVVPICCFLVVLLLIVVLFFLVRKIRRDRKRARAAPRAEPDGAHYTIEPLPTITKMNERQGVQLLRPPKLPLVQNNLRQYYCAPPGAVAKSEKQCNLWACGQNSPGGASGGKEPAYLETTIPGRAAPRRPLMDKSNVAWRNTLSKERHLPSDNTGDDRERTEQRPQAVVSAIEAVL